MKFSDPKTWGYIGFAIGVLSALVGHYNIGWAIVGGLTDGAILQIVSMIALRAFAANRRGKK